jgi:hypothetical protein
LGYNSGPEAGIWSPGDSSPEFLGAVFALIFLLGSGIVALAVLALYGLVCFVRWLLR